MTASETTSQVLVSLPAAGGPAAMASVPLDTLSFAGLLLALVAGGLLLVLNRTSRTA